MYLPSLREDLISNIRKAVDEYNSLRAPEAYAWIVNITNMTLTVGFAGTFCLTDGYLDYIDDMLYLFEERKLNLKLTEVIEIGKATYAIFEIVDGS